MPCVGHCHDCQCTYKLSIVNHHWLTASCQSSARLEWGIYKHIYVHVHVGSNVLVKPEGIALDDDGSVHVYTVQFLDILLFSLLLVLIYIHRILFTLHLLWKVVTVWMLATLSILMAMTMPPSLPSPLHCTQGNYYPCEPYISLAESGGVQ